MDPVTGYCYGCGRNNDEKKIWKDQNTNDEWKKQKFRTDTKKDERVAIRKFQRIV